MSDSQEKAFVEMVESVRDGMKADKKNILGRTKNVKACWDDIPRFQRFEIQKEYLRAKLPDHDTKEEELQHRERTLRAKYDKLYMEEKDAIHAELRHLKEEAYRVREEVISLALEKINQGRSTEPKSKRFQRGF